MKQEFKWTEELVNEFTEFIKIQKGLILKDSKSLSEEFKELKSRIQLDVDICDDDEDEIQFMIKRGTSPNKSIVIEKERLIKIVMAEENNLLIIADTRKEFLERYNFILDKGFTQKDILDAEERVFNDLKQSSFCVTFQTDLMGRDLPYTVSLGFNTFSDYKNSKIKCAVRVGMVVLDKNGVGFKRELINSIDIAEGTMMLGSKKMYIKTFLERVEKGDYDIMKY